MSSVTHSLIPACTSLLCSPGSKRFDFETGSKQNKNQKMEVKSAKWYLKCNSSSSFTSSIIGLCNYIWIQSCIQSSCSLPLYTVKLILAQTRKKMNHINKVKSRSRSIFCCSNSVYFHTWFFADHLCKVKFYLAEILRKKRFLASNVFFKES